jgi:hypothetical protein
MIALAGCNQPAVSLKLPAFQESAVTVRDWNGVAHRIASELAAHSLAPPTLLEGAVPHSPPVAYNPIYVRVNSPDSSFLQNVAEELQNDILSRGGSIARSANGAIVVNLDVAVISWGPRDKPPGLVGTTGAAIAITGILTGTAAGTWTPWQAARAASWITAAAGVATDLAIALTPTMNAEAVWQASVVTPDRVMMRVREPIYIRDMDVPLYYGDVKLAPVASFGVSSPLRARPVRYDP